MSTIRIFAAALTLALAHVASGQPNTGGGTIYYIGPFEGVTYGGTQVMTTMNSDGSNKTRLGLGMFGPPSTAPHNNHRWFVYTKPIPDSFYPDGVQRSEVFAFRDDYDHALNSTSDTKVQLTDDITLQPAVNSADWVPGDQEISFKGRRWSSSEPGATVVEGGLYTATLMFGLDGNIIGLAAQPEVPTIAFPLGSDLWPGFPNWGGYGWHPSGNAVVFVGSPGLWVADLLTGSHTQLYSGSANHPQYSPDGTKIAFTSANLAISTIRTNGTGLKQIIARTSLWSFYRPFWSPTGSHIVCTGQAQTGASNLEVFRAAANGSALTNLTNTASPLNEWPWGWR